MSRKKRSPGAPSRGVRKPRKPKALHLPDYGYECAIIRVPGVDSGNSYHDVVFDLQGGHRADECRRLAAWLTRAAEWLEYQEGRRG
jgi:hypothetical protein